MAQKKSLTMPCPKCGGAGTLPLRDELAVTLAAVGRRGRVSAEGVVKILKWHGTRAAMNNRLEDLRKIGMLRRERDGKVFFYTALS